MEKLDYVSSDSNSNAVVASADFWVRLLQNTYDAKNILISPMSLLAVLSMVRLGARGEIKEELDAVIGAKAEDMGSLLERLFTAESGKKTDDPWDRVFEKHPGATVHFANAVWLNDNGKVRFHPAYLDQCKAFPNAGVQTLPFDDAACDAINRWAKEKTNGQISRVTDSLSEDMVMFLANALYFDAKWAQAYQPSDVKQCVFTNINGKEQLVDFMECEENCYLRDTKASGFIKAYQGGRYAFAALLPEKDVPLREYIANLTGEKLLSILTNPLKHKVETRMPKFEIEQQVDLNAPLIRMGIRDAFSRESADFSGIGKPADPRDNLCIGNVWQINKIKANEEGTQAISFTGLDMLCLKSCVDLEPYRVYLDRPFLYMIIDKETSLPLFVGTVDELL